MNQNGHPPHIQFLRRLTTREDQEAVRTYNLAGAGVSLALILLLAQVGVAKPSQLASLAGAVVALPIWLGLAVRDQLWMWLKLSNVEMLQQPQIRLLHNVSHTVGAFALLTSLVALIYSLSAWVAWLFILAAALAATATIVSFVLSLFALRETAEEHLRSQKNPTTETKERA